MGLVGTLGKSGNCEKGMALGYVLQVELMKFAQELDVGYDKNVKVNNNS